MNFVPNIRIFLVITLVLMACSLATRIQDQFTATETSPVLPTAIETPPVPVPATAIETAETPTSVEINTPTLTIETPKGEVSPIEPSATGTVIEPPPSPENAEIPLKGGKPPQSQAAEIQPPERRQHLTRLSTLLSFQVLDYYGTNLGIVSDFIINTCETYIIHFLLEPAQNLNLSPESRPVIPFEVVTINSGVLDAQAETVQLYMAGDQLANAPAFSESTPLIPTDWEEDVRAYWSQIMWVSNLTTGCNVSASGGGTVTIYKVAYATDLLGSELRDGLENPLGSVKDAILEPESGKLGFFVVDLVDGQGLVMVPLRVVNIPEQALEPGGDISLVLLTENEALLSAPRINSIDEISNAAVQNKARQYWNR